MLICGLSKTTLLDYPGQVAATIFTGGCNFCCPFCHNGDLVLRSGVVEPYSMTDILNFLKKRKSVLGGVCITGGEPTLQPDLRDLILQIKELGLLVKLDTNGYRPEVLQALCEEGLLDYVAMDIKNTPEKYASTVGYLSGSTVSRSPFGSSQLDFSKIDASVSYLLHSSVTYEFRTTVVKELHTLEDLCQTASWIHGCSHYFIQSYKESEQVITPGYSAYPDSVLKKYVHMLQTILPCTTLRGID